MFPLHSSATLLQTASGADEVRIAESPFGDAKLSFFKRGFETFHYMILTEGYEYSRNPEAILREAAHAARSHFDKKSASIKHSPETIKTAYTPPWVDPDALPDYTYVTKTYSLDVSPFPATFRDESEYALDDYERTLEALAEEDAETSAMEQFTSSEQYDRIVMAVRDINRGMALRQLEPEVVQMGGAVYDEAGRPITVVEEDEYVFDRVVFADRVNSIVAVLKPARDGNVIYVRPADVEDLFPELASMIEEEIDAGGLFDSMRELGDNASALVADRVTFGKTLSEATYKTVTEATVLKAQTKKRAEESHYAANSLHGLL